MTKIKQFVMSLVFGFNAWWASLKKVPKRFFITLLTIVVAVAAHQIWLWFHFNAPMQSANYYALMKATSGVSFLRIVDDVIYTKINTEELLKDNAVAYAIYMLAYGYVIGSAFGV